MVFAEELSIERPVTPWRLLEESGIALDGEFGGARVALDIRKPNGVVRIARVIDAPGEVHVMTRSPCRWRLEGGTATTRVTVAGVAASLFPHPRRRRRGDLLYNEDLDDEEADEAA